MTIPESPCSPAFRRLDALIIFQSVPNEEKHRLWWRRIVLIHASAKVNVRFFCSFVSGHHRSIIIVITRVIVYLFSFDPYPNDPRTARVQASSEY